MGKQSTRHQRSTGIGAAASAVVLFASAVCHCALCLADESEPYSVRQITDGPDHHFFGYIGHVQTIPWNASGRYVVCLRTSFHDHLPTIEEPAEIVLLDTRNDYQPKVVTMTRGWNLQQGAMLYWNPTAPETQFFFNDRDPATGEVFTVLYDIEREARMREYRFAGSPVANSGVAQKGGKFLAINYGRLARLRPVTGYAGAPDGTSDTAAPEDDGIFRVDTESGQRTLLVSYRQLQQELITDFADIENYHLFINHTLWNRNDDRIYFYVRANFRSPLPTINVPFTIDADGRQLRRHQYIGGHPEWDLGQVLIGAAADRQVRYDTDASRINGPLTDKKVFRDPGGDIALSPDASRFVNGHKEKTRGQNVYTFLDRTSGAVVRTRGFPIGDWTSGELRIDPSPCWNREGNSILFGALEASGTTRQLFVLTLNR